MFDLVPPLGDKACEKRDFVRGECSRMILIELAQPCVERLRDGLGNHRRSNGVIENFDRPSADVIDKRNELLCEKLYVL